jgi:hypothetical protein
MSIGSALAVEDSQSNRQAMMAQRRSEPTAAIVYKFLVISESQGFESSSTPYAG